MNDRVKITGGCSCGAVNYEISQQPDDYVGYCHCRMCQKALGGPFGCFVNFTMPNTADTFKFIGAEPKYYRSSTWMERGFCAQCGSPLVVRDATGFAVMIGSLDHPEDFPPTSHCGIESQVPWLKIDDELPRRRTEDDPSFIAIIEATDKAT
jgi:adenylate cyclase